MYVFIQGGKKCKNFREFCVRNKWMIPCLTHCINANLCGTSNCPKGNFNINDISERHIKVKLSILTIRKPKYIS